MKKLLVLLAALASLSSCMLTRIVTTAPSQPVHTTTVTTAPAQPVYTTVVTHKQHTVTTQSFVIYNDPCLHLDLEAVAVAFAQSSSIREFEMLLNNYSYIITNLDLNMDGYVDYLRVVERLDGYSHVFLIQAVLGYNFFQDVATLVVENPSRYGCYVEVYGSPYLYGHNHYVRPVFVSAPTIYSYLRKTGYSVWTSPWQWNSYPSHYKKPAPVNLSHYQAYVQTYMKNNNYCHKADYPSVPYYNGYDRVMKSMQRNDYGAQHPEQSFSVRNANTEFGASALQNARLAGRSEANAYDMRVVQQATRTTSESSSARGTGTSTSVRPSGTSSSTSRTTTGTSTSASTSTSTSTSSGSSTRPATSTSTGTSTATTTTRPATTGTTTRPATTGTTTRPATSGTTSTRPVAGTTVTSSVRTSGSSGTTTRTVDSTGATSTVRRGSTATTTSSTRTAATSSTSTRTTTSEGFSTRR